MFREYKYGSRWADAIFLAREFSATNDLTLWRDDNEDEILRKFVDHADKTQRQYWSDLCSPQQSQILACKVALGGRLS